MINFDEEDHKIATIPQVLAPKWRGLVSEMAAIDPKRKLVMAPGGLSDEDIYARMHELLHVRHTPKKTPEELCTKYGIANVESLQVAEDIRLAALFYTTDQRHLLPSHVERLIELELNPTQESTVEIVDQTVNSLSQITHFLEQGVPIPPTYLYGWLLRECSMAGTTRYAAMQTAVACAGREYADDTGASELSTIAHVLTTLSSYAHELYCEQPRLSGIKGRRGFVRFTIPLARFLDTLLQPPCGKRRATNDGPPGPWGAMDIVELPLQATPQTKKRLIKALRPDDRGTVPRFIERWCSDQLVFGTKRFSRRASVLIDASGSMSLSQEEIAAFAAQYPASVIAYYSGQSTAGALAIAAKDGLVATTLPSYGSGNIVDGPALGWLAAQPEPRFVVTDCDWTGLCDRRVDFETHMATTDFMKQKRITHVSRFDKLARR